MAVTTAAVVAAGASAYSSYSGAKSQEKAANAAMNAAGRNVELYPFSTRDQTGLGANYYGQSGMTLNYGAFNPAIQNLAGIANNATNAAQYGGLPQGVLDAQQMLSQYNNPFSNPVGAEQAGLSGSLAQAFQQAAQGYNNLSAPTGLAGTAFTGAGNQLQAASQGFGDVQAQTLANLRAQAQPFETRQFENLQNNLFSTGRLGSSGGALQTEAFARGLGQADLSRQLEATNQARLTQQNALSLAQGMGGLGDSLLTSAFNRFGSSASLLGSNLQDRFSNSALVRNMNQSQANQNLSNQVQLAQLPTALQSGNLALALQAGQGYSGFQNSALNMFNSQLAATQAQANARLGQASNVVSAANNPNFGATNEVLGSLFGGIANRFGGDNGALAGLFGQAANSGRGGGYVPINSGMQNLQFDPNFGINMPQYAF